MGRRLPFAIRLTNVCLLLLRTTKRPFRIRPAPAIRSPDLRGLHPERFSRGRWGATTILICWCAPETEVVAHSGSRWAPPLARILELRTLLAWKSGASVCPTGYCHRPSKRTVESTRANSSRCYQSSPHLGFWHPRVQTRDGPRPRGADGYRACPGATTMQGCWLAASRAQAAFAALADRLLRRARYKTLPPKAEVGKSSIWAEVSRSTSAS